MNNNTTNINIRMDREIKEQAESLYNALGMNITTAFNIFVRQSLRERGIPFAISLNTPNSETLAAMQETEDMISGKLPKSHQSIESLFEELSIDVKS